MEDAECPRRSSLCPGRLRSWPRSYSIKIMWCPAHLVTPHRPPANNSHTCEYHIRKSQESLYSTSAESTPRTVPDGGALTCSDAAQAAPGTSSSKHRPALIVTLMGAPAPPRKRPVTFTLPGAPCGRLS